MATDSSQYLDDDFREWVQGLLEKHHVPGASIAVIDGEYVETGGCGLARLPDVPATSDTIYLMCSTTKAFVAATVGLILDERNQAADSASEKLSWTTPIAQILPDDFVMPDAYATANTTIEDALSHRSGLPSHDLLYGPWAGRSSGAWTRRLRNLDPLTEPFRTKFQYNNLMYGVVGQVAEKLDGKDFASIIRERLYRPLDMNSSFWGVCEAARAVEAGKVSPSAFARGYYWAVDDSAKQDGAGHYVPEPYFDLVGLNPAGGNCSTVTDYVKWVKALLQAAKISDKDEKKDQEGEKDAGLVISRKLFTDVTTPCTIILPPLVFFPDIMPLPENSHLIPPLYALGWQMDPYTYPGEIIFQHGGGGPGFGIGVALIPNKQFGVIVATNTSMTGNKVCELVVQDLMGKKLGIAKEKRRKDWKGKKDGDKKNDEEEKNENKQEEQKSATDAPSKPEDVAEFAGSYVHPAYGTFIVTSSPTLSLATEAPTLDSKRIIRKPQKKDNGDTSPAAKLSKTASALEVNPFGKRTIRQTLVLHPALSQDSKSGSEIQHHFFDLEKLSPHGNMEDEPFPGFKAGYGRADDAKYPGSTEMLWESQETLKFGAVMETALSMVEGKSGSRYVQRMGLKLFRSDMAKPIPGQTKPAEGWEKTMVWFEKVDER